jgi:hypothetical protein
MVGKQADHNFDYVGIRSRCSHIPDLVPSLTGHIDMKKDLVKILEWKQ